MLRLWEFVRIFYDLNLELIIGHACDSSYSASDSYIMELREHERLLPNLNFELRNSRTFQLLMASSSAFGTKVISFLTLNFSILICFSWCGRVFAEQLLQIFRAYAAKILEIVTLIISEIKHLLKVLKKCWVFISEYVLTCYQLPASFRFLVRISFLRTNFWTLRE